MQKEKERPQNTELSLDSLNARNTLGSAKAPDDSNHCDKLAHMFYPSNLSHKDYISQRS